MQALLKSLVFALALIVLPAPQALASLGHDNGGRTWNVYGPDRSGTYGGRGGLEKGKRGQVQFPIQSEVENVPVPFSSY
jgi:hypothetical protein